MLSDGSSILPISTITDTPFDTIVSRGVSLFNREKRSDYKGFVVTALHFMVSVAKIKWFLQGRIISDHKILWKYIVKQPNFVKQPIAEKIASGKQRFCRPGFYICTVISCPVLK